MRRGQAKTVLGYIAANVRRRRLSEGLTQEQLAELADLEPSFLQKIERGSTNLSVEVLVVLAEALDARPEALLRRAVALPRRPGRPVKRA